MANQWFKFYGGEYLSDGKIGRLTDSERSCWLTLLCMASQADDGIIKFLAIDDLLTKSGIKWDPYNEGSWEKCQSVLTKLSGMKMIKVDTEQSSVEIVNWNKRQERIAQTPYERVKKHRKNKAKIENDNAIDNGDNENDNDRIEENRIEENKESKAKAFSPPLPEEVKKYCQERKNKINSQNFVDFYQTKGWMVGKNKMKDWKACVRTWEGRDQEETKKSSSEDRHYPTVQEIMADHGVTE